MLSCQKQLQQEWFELKSKPWLIVYPEIPVSPYLFVRMSWNSFFKSGFRIIQKGETMFFRCWQLFPGFVYSWVRQLANHKSWNVTFTSCPGKSAHWQWNIIACFKHGSVIFLGGFVMNVPKFRGGLPEISRMKMVGFINLSVDLKRGTQETAAFWMMVPILKSLTNTKVVLSDSSTSFTMFNRCLNHHPKIARGWKRKKVSCSNLLMSLRARFDSRGYAYAGCRYLRIL